VDRKLEPTSSHAPESIPYAHKSPRQISHDELGLEMEDAKAKRMKPSMAPSVSAAPSSVIRPVDLDDEATGGGEKVHDVFGEHDLPSERDSELLAGEMIPKPSFGECGRGAHDASAFVEQGRASRGLTVQRRTDSFARRSGRAQHLGAQAA
jgi:hypothetical protein